MIIRAETTCQLPYSETRRAKKKKRKKKTHTHKRLFNNDNNRITFDHLLLNGREVIVTPLLLMVLIELAAGRRDRRNDLTVAVVNAMLLMDTRMKLFQRDEFLRLLTRLEELRVTLCHFLGHHLLLWWSTKAQKILQLLLLLLLLLLLFLAITMASRVLLLMLVEAAGIHAGAIADHNIVLHDTTAIWQ